MKTLLTKDVDEAAKFIRGGGVVAFPTETVYGLGANVFDANAIAKVFAAKGRPNDNPLIIHISDLEQLDLLAAAHGPNTARLIENFFPGPLTVVLPKAVGVPLSATAGLETAGIRMPANETGRHFITACGTPLVAPSANISGRPSPTTWQAVLDDLNGKIDCILQGDPANIGLESTVVDCTDDATPRVLRTGAVSLDELKKIVPATEYHLFGDGETARSPGMKYRHYAPQARVRFWNGEAVRSGEAFIGLSQPPAGAGSHVRICDTAAEYARELFAFFRECDRRGIAVIYCEKVPAEGIGTALIDRITRAAAAS